ncbi:organic hydroperoxide resistance transcriptional regulator [Clostridia bacterium]|nr:organic hydroperoxide resistance transcriptional regulator [Clostridia bacterium]
MNNDSLNIKSQLCFPLYAAAKEVVKLYKPLLDEIGLTYTQYITMMVLWEHQTLNVKTLGQYLYLDSGTLTPLLKKLEKNGLVIRSRSDKDERECVVTLSEEGFKLREQAREIPKKLGECIPLSTEEAGTLYTLLYKVLQKTKEKS